MGAREDHPPPPPTSHATTLAQRSICICEDSGFGFRFGVCRYSDGDAAVPLAATGGAAAFRGQNKSCAAAAAAGSKCGLI